MRLQPGFPIVVYPTFHMPIDLRERVSIGTGVERAGDALVPRTNWRRPDEHELHCLLNPDSPPNLLASLCLFQLPQHLRTAWWTILENASSAGLTRLDLDGFEPFAGKVATFLHFKEISPPPRATFELLLTKPGQRTLGLLRHPTGLTLHGTTPNDAWWGGINLGDEPTSLVFVNLPATMLHAELARSHPDLAPPDTPQALAQRFLTQCADYPLVRLRIDSGEGFRLPNTGLIIDGDPSDKQEPNLLLLISAPENKKP